MAVLKNYQQFISILVVVGFLSLLFSCCAGAFTTKMPLGAAIKNSKLCRDIVISENSAMSHGCGQFALSSMPSVVSHPMSSLSWAGMVFLALLIFRNGLKIFVEEAIFKKEKWKEFEFNFFNIYKTLFFRGILHPKHF